MTAKARETNFSLADVPKEEIFNLTDLEDFKITLVNGGGQVEIISINEWKKAHLG